MAAVVVRKTQPPGLGTAGECVLQGTLVLEIDPAAAVDPWHCTSVGENDRSGVFLWPQLRGSSSNQEYRYRQKIYRWKRGGERDGSTNYSSKPKADKGVHVKKGSWEITNLKLNQHWIIIDCNVQCCNISTHSNLYSGTSLTPETAMMWNRLT